MANHCYIHIPFCERICSYCDFCKRYPYQEVVDEYLTALKKEIEDLYQQEELETIYIGGGTPSCLRIKDLETLFEILKPLKKKKEIEFTIEGNFESTTKEKLELYKKVGINRLSFGIESFHPKNLSFLERGLDISHIQEVLKEARSLGFDNINLDLMYALPTETIEEVKEDIQKILSLNPDHISTYSLIIEDHTKIKIKGEKPISEELDAEMYELICKELKKNGYIHYEISNFSKEKKESHHNLCYWDNKEYYGFGLGASSYLNHKRIMNTRSLTNYRIGKRVVEVEELDNHSTIEYEVLLNLRKREGIDLNHFKETYHKDFFELFLVEDLIQKKFLLVENNHLMIPEEKWYISNEIIVQILEREKYE